MAEDENDEPLKTLVYRGCHLILKEALSPQEETILKALIDECREHGVSPARVVAAFDCEAQ